VTGGNKRSRQEEQQEQEEEAIADAAAAAGLTRARTQSKCRRSRQEGQEERGYSRCSSSSSEVIESPAAVKQMGPGIVWGSRGGRTNTNRKGGQDVMIV
jgi:hypothetical protein